MSNQNPFDLPSGKSDRQEYHHEVYATSSAGQLPPILEEVLEEQKEKRADRW